MLFYTIKKILKPFVKVASFISRPIFGNFGADFKPKYQDCLFAFAVLSDIHMVDKSWYKKETGVFDGNWRRNKLTKAIIDINASKRPIDALVTVGDTTDHGEVRYWESAKEIFAKLTTQNVFLPIGNHDCWTTAPDDVVDKEHYFAEIYTKYRNEISKTDSDKIYFSKDYNGYKFIALGGNENEKGVEIDDLQLEFLDRELLLGAKDDKPVFVLSHQALNRTHGLPKTFGDKIYTENTGGIGEKSDKVKDILKKYKNVFLISGHSHMGFSGVIKPWSNYQKIDNIHSFNVPCYMFPNHDGLPNSGCGYVYEIYKDKVIIRARSFVWGVWYSLYEYNIKLV